MRNCTILFFCKKYSAVRWIFNFEYILVASCILLSALEVVLNNFKDNTLIDLFFSVSCIFKKKKLLNFFVGGKNYEWDFG